MGMLLRRHEIKIENMTRLGDVSPLANVKETPQENLVSEKKYTKTEISKMSTAELQTLASNEGIEDAESTSGTQLKKILVEHFGL